MPLTQVGAADFLGVNQSAISRAIAQGRIKTVQKDGKPMLNSDTLLEQWNATTSRPIPVGPDGQPRPRRHGSRSEPRRSLTSAQAAADVPDLAESRARHEYLKAELLEIERRRKEGELVEAEAVRRASFELGNQVKELLMGIADRLAYICAAETDPAKVHQLITDEHRNALRAFCDEAD